MYLLGWSHSFIIFGSTSKLRWFRPVAASLALSARRHKKRESTGGHCRVTFRLSIFGCCSFAKVSPTEPRIQWGATVNRSSGFERENLVLLHGLLDHPEFIRLLAFKASGFKVNPTKRTKRISRLCGLVVGQSIFTCMVRSKDKIKLMPK
jgi:hypothetical protein